MVTNNMNIFGITFRPFKDNSILIIDSYRMFAFVIAFECF